MKQRTKGGIVAATFTAIMLAGLIAGCIGVAGAVSTIVAPSPTVERRDTVGIAAVAPAWERAAIMAMYDR